ncbi:hypothetical protein LIER_28092 [Lithospermum erythrorhizon]|uniref:NADP-dependent oxidoreductase domain-containing protein n=1 Tax=Lithospermum erythrorhizon TaxID=34254 RepID=A0AAV3RIF1_LITER
MHVAWQQKKLVEFCKEKGIHVTAWAPLGANGSLYASAVMQSPVLNSIATAKQKSVAQVALRGSSFVEMFINPDGGQYKTLEEFWDEEQ